MASKNTQLQIEKYIAKHPEILGLKKQKMSFVFFAIALTVVFDWLIARGKADGRDYQADCEELMEFFIGQVIEVGQNDWSSYIDDVSPMITEDVGFNPVDRLKEIVGELGL